MVAGIPAYPLRRGAADGAQETSASYNPLRHVRCLANDESRPPAPPLTTAVSSTYYEKLCRRRGTARRATPVENRPALSLQHSSNLYILSWLYYVHKLDAQRRDSTFAPAP